MIARSQILELNEDAVFFEEKYLDQAIIGIAHIGSIIVAAYDLHKLLTILMDKEEMTYEEALDHCYYNMVGSLQAGDHPVIIDTEF